MAKKIIASMMFLVIVSLLFCGCSGEGKEIEFAFGYVSESRGIERPIKVLVRSLIEWNMSDASKKITIGEKYDNEFFDEHALIVVGFGTPTIVGSIDEVKVIRRGNNLTVYINGSNGVATMISEEIIAVEVLKKDINFVRSVGFETNLHHYK